MSKFPADFPEVAHKIFTRIFRVYAIIYHSHFDVSALASRLLFRALTTARSPRSSLPLALAHRSSSRRARRLTSTRHSSTSYTLRTRTACSRRRSTRRSKSPWSACCSSTTRPSDRDLTRRWRGGPAIRACENSFRSIEQTIPPLGPRCVLPLHAARRRRRRRPRRRRCGVVSASSLEPARAGAGPSSRPELGDLAAASMSSLTRGRPSSEPRSRTALSPARVPAPTPSLSTFCAARACALSRSRDPSSRARRPTRKARTAAAARPSCGGRRASRRGHHRDVLDPTLRTSGVAQARRQEPHSRRAATAGQLVCACTRCCWQRGRE